LFPCLPLSTPRSGSISLISSRSGPHFPSKGSVLAPQRPKPLLKVQYLLTAATEGNFRVLLWFILLYNQLLNLA
jgi:hypothetical protein